jgi:phage gpG-like protein
MISFKIKGNGLTPMNTRWWNPTKKEWAPVLANDQKPFWPKQSDPTTGRPWAALTPRYNSYKAQKYPGQPILRATGSMQDTMEIRVRGNVFSVWGVPYGKYHQFGTKRMVARPWVGVPDSSLEHIVPIAWKNILSRKR